MCELGINDFERVNFSVLCCDIDGGHHIGGITVILNCQNSNKLFVMGNGFNHEEEICSFQDGITKANAYLSTKKTRGEHV